MEVQKFAHAERLFHVLIGVHEGDAALGGAEFFIGEALLFEAVLLHVVRHGDDGAVRNFEVFGRDRYARLAQARHFAREVLDIDDHAGAHDAHDALAQNARREQVEDKLSPLVDDGVPRVVAALVSADDIVIFGQKVDHSALSLVSPVDADD